MSSRALRLLAAGAAFALYLPLRAQVQPSPVFRSGVDHVMVDGVVTDKGDRPVIGLTKDDFTILEQGKLPPAEYTLEISAHQSDEQPVSRPVPFRLK